MRRLGVYCNDKKAGVLTEQNPGRGYAFCYDPRHEQQFLGVAAFLFCYKSVK